jgi:hypothetical protein
MQQSRAANSDFLTTAYADSSGHRIACRCACSKLVFAAAAEDLVNGTVDSCGCMPPTAAHYEQLEELFAQLRRQSPP